MKVFLLVLAISTTVLGQSPRAPCRVVYANGTIVNNGCFSVGGLIVCEPVDLQYDDIASISFCSPKTCKTNADCSTIDPTSVCTSEPLTPDMDALEALMDSCFPNRPKRPRRQRSVRSEYGRRSNWPLRCSMSADLIVYVELDFKELDLGTLEMDYKHMNSCMMLPGIYLLDGWWDNTDSIGHPVCGKTNNLTSEQRIRRSTGRELGLIYFNNGGHFQVQFNIVDSPGKTVCPSSTVELSGSGTIKFPIKEDIYVNEEECRWKITASEGKRVKLTNKKNDIAGYRMYYPYDDCMASMHTGLQVFDNPTFTNPPMQEFCYGYIGKNVTEMISSGNVVTLLFETSQTYFGTGFEMDYEEI